MKRNKFSLSHYKLLSCDMGELVPVGLQEVLPGDTIQHATSALIRCSPMLAPVMHPVHARIHHFFVPHRLVWDNWENFITGGPDGEDDSVLPTIELSYTAGSPDTGSGVVGQLADYLGCPTKVDGLAVSALPFRAYALVFNEWFRDQDLVSEVGISKADGLDTTTNTNLLRAAWEKDYFTSARPWEQKGPAITLPIGDSAPVVAQGSLPVQGFGVTGTAASISSRWDDVAGSTSRNGITAAQGPLAIQVDGDGRHMARVGMSNLDAYADLSQAAAVSITALREAFALQRYQEARARYGSRYTEYLRYLGVRSSDARLQRPEYLGGGKQTIQFSEVLQTAEGTDPVGEMRGHGISAMRSNRYRRFFEEHGYVITLLSVKPKTIYTQGLSRTWNRRVKEDFWQKELEHVGQQEVLNKEVYAAHSQPDGVFGYQDRYDEYRRTESMVAGEFRTSELDYWHFARQFSGPPALNADFVTANPSEEPFAVPSRDVLYCMVNHSIQARRMLSKTGRSFIL